MLVKGALFYLLDFLRGDQKAKYSALETEQAYNDTKPVK